MALTPLDFLLMLPALAPVALAFAILRSAARRHRAAQEELAAVAQHPPQSGRLAPGKPAEDRRLVLVPAQDRPDGEEQLVQDAVG